MAMIIAAQLSERCANLSADIATIKTMERLNVGYSDTYRSEAALVIAEFRADLARIEEHLAATDPKAVRLAA
jgi:hypothetical protein